MLTESFEERLRWIDPNHYERGSDLIIVEETQEDGKARIYCEVSNDVIKMKLERKNSIRYLKRQNVADAVLFEFITPRSVRLHIIEFKATVTAENWNDAIRLQFEGALLNALAFMGIMGLSDIRDVVFYTVFRKERISGQSIPNLASYKALPKEQRDDVEKRINAKEEWEKGSIRILSIKKALHRKFELDKNREARITLNKNQKQS